MVVRTSCEQNNFQHIGYISHIFLANFQTYFGDAFYKINKPHPEVIAQRFKGNVVLKNSQNLQEKILVKIAQSLRLYRVCNIIKKRLSSSFKGVFWRIFKKLSEQLEAVAQGYFIKKVFSPNINLNEKAKVLTQTFTLYILHLTFLLKRWINEKYHQHCAHYI